MRVLMMMKWDGVTSDQYEQVRKIANWEGNNPKGGVIHVAGFHDNALRVMDVWESAEEMNDFVQNRLMPAVAQTEIKTEPVVEVFPLHAMYVPNGKVLA